MEEPTNIDKMQNVNNMVIEATPQNITRWPVENIFKEIIIRKFDRWSSSPTIRFPLIIGHVSNLNTELD